MAPSASPLPPVPRPPSTPPTHIHTSGAPASPPARRSRRTAPCRAAAPPAPPPRCPSHQSRREVVVGGGLGGGLLRGGKPDRGSRGSKLARRVNSTSSLRGPPAHPRPPTSKSACGWRGSSTVAAPPAAAAPVLAPPLHCSLLAQTPGVLLPVFAKLTAALLARSHQSR